MSEQLRLEAERIKLARALGCAPDEVAFAERLGVSGMRRLRETISAALFDEHAHLFGKLAEAGRLLPAGINALLSEKVFGPLLSARVSGMLPPDKAVAIAEKLPVPFLADVTIELDPRRTRELLARMPRKITLAVSAELERRGEFITMARFIDVLPLDEVLAVADQLGDEALVQIGFYAEDATRLTGIIAHLPPERLAATVRLAAEADGLLRDAAEALILAVDDDACAHIAEAARQHAPDALDAIAEAAATAAADAPIRQAARRLGIVD